MKNRVLCFLLLCLLLWTGNACAESAVTSLEQLNAPGITIGVSQGDIAEQVLKNELPMATVSYYVDKFMGYMAVAQGKIDAFAYDRRQMELSIENGQKGVHLLEETLNETMKIAVGISPVSKIPDLTGKINRFIAELRADGTLDDMFNRWVIQADETMPDIPRAENPSVHLTVGTSSIVPPYSYYAGKELNGCDIELAYRFAAWLGADVQFKVYDYGAIVPAAAVGDIDCIMANLEYSEERTEGMLYSDILFEVEIGLMVRGDAAPAAKAAQQEPSALDAMNGKRMGIVTGTNFEAPTLQFFPNSQYLYFDSNSDVVTALTNNKIDGFLCDEPVIRVICKEVPEITYLTEKVTQDDYAFGFGKNMERADRIRGQFDEMLSQIMADGTLNSLHDKWFGDDEDVKTVDLTGFSGENGQLNVVTTCASIPFSYIKDGKMVGIAIELVEMFCRRYGYTPYIEDVAVAARIPGLVTGKYDMCAAPLTITEERRESINFSDPYYQGGIVLAVRKADAAALTSESAGLSGQGTASTLDALKGKRIGVQTGTICGPLVEASISDAQVSYFNSQTDLLAAVKSRKIDAWCHDEPVIRFMSIDNPELKILDGYLAESNLAAIFPKTEAGQKLRDQYSAFVEKLWADGTMREIDSIWFGTDEEKRTVLDYEALPADNGTLRMAVDASILPFAYVKGNRIVGYDVDIAARFCQEYGYRLETAQMSFDGVLATVQSGKCDFAACCITITEERAESMLFSSPNYYGGIALAVLNDDGSTPRQDGGISSLSEMNGKRIGVQTGTTFDEIVLETLPDAVVSYFNSYPDMAAALEANKIDAFPGDEPVIRLMAAENKKLTVLEERMDDFDFGIALPKTEAGEKLLAEINAWLASMKESGELALLTKKWTDGPESEKTVPNYASFPAPNGVLTLATEGAYAPMNYYRGDEVVGMEIDMIARFCEANGYGLKVVPMLFDGILPAIQSGKADIAAAGLTITEERKESVNFSDPYYTGGTVMAVLKMEEASAAGTAKEDTSFWDGIVSSFNKTFIREDRWELFANGVLTTLLITVLSILLGTALGFAVFMMCRNGNIVANGVTRFSMWLVQGMPMVVLLMILYYIIFGSVAISGVVVAVIGFTLTFGASVFGLLKMGVGTIDRGQYEAAYALGYANRRTFFRIILPQAIPHIMPAYKGEIVSLIKATAIVGYIAVQDLTKMGDIVRSRTYEAFFPLIAVTVIYFILESLLGFLVSKTQIRMNPKKRKPETILKGVKTHD